MFVKVCGIRTAEQIDWAVELGYAAVGFVLHPPSPRFVEPDTAIFLTRHAAGRIATVAVGVTYEETAPLEGMCDYLQIYEFLPRERIIFAGSDPPPADCAAFLYDPGRGDGIARPLPSWLSSVTVPLIIAGGLTPDNVAEAITRYRPWGVDVSSGVERVRGRKDYGLMRRFIEEVRNAVP